jgi:hypothetical protein
VKKPNYWKHDDAIHKLDPKGQENLKVTWRYRLELLEVMFEEKAE